jgi:CheY-like chemotaxis protein
MDYNYKILEYMTIGSSLHDEYGNIIYANPIFCDLFNTNISLILNKKFNENLFKIEIEKNDFISYFNLNFNKIKNYTIKIINQNIIKWIKINSIKIKNGTTFYLLTFDDITDSVNSSFLYEEIFNNIKSGIVLLKSDDGKNFIVKDINPYALKLDKLEKYDIINKNIKLFNLPLFNGKPLYITLKEVWKTGNSKESKYYKCTYNNKETWRNMYVYKTISNDIIVLYEDVTEIIKSKKKIEQADKMKSTFLSNMSHEIRSPLNAIIGFSDLLDTNNKKEYISIIKQSSISLLKLIDDILDMSKIEVGQLSINKTIFNIKNSFNELYNTNYPLLKNNVLLNIKKINDDIFINTDELRFKQILNNLINNSIKFTESGNIEVGYNIIKKNIIFYVKDTGIGISNEDKDKIFNRFYRKTTKYGNGLGLCISKELSKLMNGDIWVESEINKGSTFYFKLPYNNEQNNIKKININNINIPNLKNKTILIVEDIQFNIKLLTSYLESTNVNIIIAETGNDALLKYNDNKNNIDLILMDIQIPDIEGTEITKIIRIFDNNIPIIAQTAYAIKEEIDNIMSYGFSDLIKKPIRKEELLNIITKYLLK